jgi:acyl carrier protein
MELIASRWGVAQYFVIDSASIVAVVRCYARTKEDQETSMEETAMVVHDFILREFLPGEIPSELTNDTELITGGILDSISTLKLVTFLEDRFGITVEAWEAAVDNLDSIQRIVALVDSKKNGQ